MNIESKDEVCEFILTYKGLKTSWILWTENFFLMKMFCESKMKWSNIKMSKDCMAAISAIIMAWRKRYMHYFVGGVRIWQKIFFLTCTFGSTVNLITSFIKVYQRVEKFIRVRQKFLHVIQNVFLKSPTVIHAMRKPARKFQNIFQLQIFPLNSRHTNQTELEKFTNRRE